MMKSNEVDRLVREVEDNADFQRAMLEADVLNRVARRVIRFRKVHGISQSDLAGRMGMSQPRIAKIEAGEANLTLKGLVQLSIALECYPEDLISEATPRALAARWEASPLDVAAALSAPLLVSIVKTQAKPAWTIDTGKLAA